MGALEDIVKANDIRGLVPDQLTPTIARCLGAAFCDLVGRQILVGHDMRTSAAELVEAFIDGARSRGANVTHVGLCSTDGLYFASGSLDLPGVIFTASHNPAQYNGLKLCYAGARPIGKETGLPDLASRAQHYLDSGIEATQPGELTRRDILADYAQYLRGLVALSGERRLKVVVDAGNGMAGLTAGAVLGTEAGLPDIGIDLVPMYFDLDGTFPNHEPNPLDPANLLDLQTTVIAQQADLGLAFDGDADRCFVIDEKGVPVDPSAIITLVGLREVAKEQQQGNAPVIIRNLITSRAVTDLIGVAGGEVVTTRVGHAYIKEEMAARDAVFGGEHSAHYYFRDFFYADSGMLAALHVLSALAESDLQASDLAAMYTPNTSSGEINSTVTDVGHTLARIRAEFAADLHARRVTIEDTDGLTFSHWDATPRWWFNVRPSNTEPLLRLNVEAEDGDVMEKIRDSVLAIIRQENS